MKGSSIRHPQGINSGYILGRSSLNITDCLACFFFSIVALYSFLIFFSWLLLPGLTIALIINPVERSNLFFISLALLLSPLIVIIISKSIRNRGSIYELLDASALTYFGLVGAVVLMNPIGVIALIPIVSILELKNKFLVKQYKIARRVESFKIFLTFFATVPWVILSLFIAVVSIAIEKTPNLNFLVGTPTLLYILFKMSMSYREAKDLRGLESVEGAIKNRIDARLDMIIDGLPLDREKAVLRNCDPQYLIDKDNYTAAPSMIVSSGRPHIIFPLGYLKVMNSDPATADAMLSHELAHYLHKDSNFLLWVRSYYESSRRITPLVILGPIIAFFINSIGSESKPSFLPYLYFAFLAFITVEGLMLFLRRRVEVAEELADIFAAIAVNPSSVTRFLKEYVTSDDLREALDFYDRPLHPLVSRRLEIAENLANFTLLTPPPIT